MEKQSKSKPKTKQKPNITVEKARKRDALALAELIYDIYQEKKFKEVSNETAG
jgi:predicted RNase H-like nuclease (RuvC/YqgF family)